MSLSSASNTINALGIFGRLEPKLESYFKELSEKYSQYPENDDAIGIFNHLSVAIGRDVSTGNLSLYIDLLRDLKPFLPLKIQTNGVIIKDEKHVALSYDQNQLKEIQEIANKLLPEVVVKPFYQKVVWYVPEDKHREAMNIVEEVKELTYGDFILCANRQEDNYTIYSSNRYKFL